MRRTAWTFLVVIAFAAWPAAPQGALAGQCGLPDGHPLWIDYADASVSFWKQIFARPGLVLASTGLGQPTLLRAAGARTVYFDLYLNKRVGTPSAPADPATIADRANKLFAYAAQSSGCATPLIAENELFGSWTTTPWSPTNAQYRANVLAFLQALAARGARPFLLLSSPPYTGGAAGDWWRQVSQVADVVREFFINPPTISREGPLLGSRGLRTNMRHAVADFTSIGIPASRIGLMLEFESAPGQGGRQGLQPAAAWFDVVKLEALAAKQVAGELGISTIWSWGWATFAPQDEDPDKPAAACVYLWARDQSLCNGPARAGTGFDASLSEGQIDLPTGVQCSLPSGRINARDVAALAAVTGDPEAAAGALVERLILAERGRPDPNLVLAAERQVIRLHFRGVRAYYVDALTRARLGPAMAEAILADELDRAQIEDTLKVQPPEAEAVSALYASYAGASTRWVEAEPAQWWLGGRRMGLAVDSVAPLLVFTLGTGRTATVITGAGASSVRALSPPLPLSAIPFSLAQPALSAALTHFALDDAYQAWLLQQETAELAQATCLGDDLPGPGAVDLTAYAPFLQLS